MEMISFPAILYPSSGGLPMLSLIFKPIDTAVLIYFRFFAGTLLAMELMGRVNSGKLSSFHTILALAGLGVAIGYHQRLCALLLTTGYLSLTYQTGHHLEFFYLSLSFSLILFPIKRQRSQIWLYGILLFHIFYLLIFEAILALTRFPTSIWDNNIFIIHLAIIPLLMWKKTRVISFSTIAVIHLWRSGIGNIFPWMIIMMTPLFFGTSWPRYFTWFDDFFSEFKRSTIPLSSRHLWICAGIITYALSLIMVPAVMYLGQKKDVLAALQVMSMMD